MKKILNHPVLGKISLELRTTSRSVTARWRGDTVHFIAPRTITASKLSEVIDRMAPRLMACKPAYESKIAEGRKLQFADFNIAFSRQSARPDTILAYPRLPDIIVSIGTGFDLAESSTAVTARKVIDNVATAIAPQLLLQRAKDIAVRLGITDCDWRIGRGKRTLGTCSARRMITLSSQMVFYSREVRDYLVCHELAHLNEMNHSAAFHNICDRYCRHILDSSEAQLEAGLKREARLLKEILP